MAGSDAILIGEDWISEHFFTTDATSQSFQALVVARRKAWDEAKDAGTTRTRFIEARRWLLDRLSGLGVADDETDLIPDPDEVLPQVYARVLEVLGYGGIGLRIERTGPVLRVSAPGMTERSPLAIVEAAATGSVETLLNKNADTLLAPFRLDDETELPSVARTLSALFVADEAPDYALVLGGRFLLVAEKARWAEGRYLAVDLQLVCERNDDRRGGEVDRALTCVSAESLAPDAEGGIWWDQTFGDSIKHTVGVSKDLREGVRLSIEILANEVVRRRARQGLPPLPADQAQPLAIQSLRFLYRILFLLYAEASPELGVLPVGSPEYERGYSLDRLRELTLVELAGHSAQDGSHLYDSLAVLFRLVDRDTKTIADDGRPPEGLEFRSLRADLFRPAATAHIDEVGLGNAALQQVLRHLLLSKESRGKDRGFISYAELGINQLGAVYEGLMSYTGFFAETDLFEVAKGGDASKGSWVVPVDRADDISPTDFVRAEDPVTGELRPVLHERGTFVFRLAGRERQQSASYYTPEVLTRFVVSQALEELLDQDGSTTPAEEILGLTVCEPALGSGAFAIEAVRQLAEQYLRRRQEELGERIEPDEYPRRLQEVKAYLALHQVYGVDLNATAVELAEISLWLDTMVEGLDAPWFGLHLRRGNSLIGARRAMFRRDQVTKKTWLNDVPTDAPLTSLAKDVEDETLASGVGGQVHHFLVPSAGWGAAVDAKEAKALAPEALDRLKTWRKDIQAKPTTKQVDALVDLGYRVEALWQIAFRRLQIAEREIRRAIPVWGSELPTEGGAVQREQIEAALADAAGAYRRLRRVMDAWCALWFWPLTDTLTTRLVDGRREHVHPPTLDQWIDALQMLLGRHAGKGRVAAGQQTIAAGSTWDELGDFESNDLGFASAYSVSAVLDKHPWLRVCEYVAAQQGFFHWELDFAAVFARGGFSLQVGNPPWVRPRSDVDALLAEGDPWWQLAIKPSETLRAVKRAETLTLPGIADLVVDGTADVAATAAFVGSAQQYPHLAGLQPDLYRCFMEQAWRHNSNHGAIALIHPDSHFTDEKAGLLRAAAYERLRRCWLFINRLGLFDIGTLVPYGVHVYANPGNTRFIVASSLYHPDTVVRSLSQDGSGTEPGLKDPDGQWDLRPHRNRIVTATDETLATWRAVLEGPEVPLRRTRMVYAVNRSTVSVLEKISQSSRIAELGLEFSRGWDESIDRKKGYFELAWGAPNSWNDVILQGPHLFVATPFYKTPNKTMLNKQDWSATDFEALPANAIPVTAYKPSGDRYDYDCGYTEWGDSGNPKPARDYYRVAWRNMTDNSGSRSLIPAIIPPGAAHVHGVASLGSSKADPSLVVAVSAFLSSLISDFAVRVAPKSTISPSTIRRLAYVDSALRGELLLRALRLNAVTGAYSDLWESCFSTNFYEDGWTKPASGADQIHLGDVAPQWSENTPLRVAADRRQALLEIDAIVAVVLGLSIDELSTIYKTQFPILYGYDRNRDYFDSNGRLVPNSVLTTWRSKGGRISEEERTATNPAGNTYTYELPFLTLDREADMRQAYAHFEQLLKDRS
ncbi:class I SAM-dependent DNA methyltransferase [Geodermatophilus sp. SYSU D00758]